MLKIAITGNIASGKSAVENHLQKLGYKVFDTDKIAHQILETSPEVKKTFEIRTEEHKELDKYGNRTPIYESYSYFSHIKYHFNNVYDMLMFNIESEKKAIERYKETIKYTQNKSIKDLLERIILDEQTHLEIFSRLK